MVVGVVVSGASRDALTPEAKRVGFEEKLQEIGNELAARRQHDMDALMSALSAAGNGDNYNVNPFLLRPEIAGNQAWDFLDPDELNRILGGMARHAVQSAYAGTPLYRELFGDNLSELLQKARDIESIEDLLDFPLLVKDGWEVNGFEVAGFRDIAVRNPAVLMPSDLYSWMHATGKQPYWFSSGGTKGNSTATILTPDDLLAESYALAFRCLLRGGFYNGAVFFSLYNEGHKGGACLKKAAELLGLTYYGKQDMDEYLSHHTEHGKRWQELSARLAEGGLSEHEQQEMARLIGVFIKDHKVNILAGVQPPEEFLTKNAKGNMITFGDILRYAPKDAFDTVQCAFITGFPYPMYLQQLLKEKGITGFTTWGATEIMACYTFPLIPNSYPNLSEIPENVNSLVGIRYPNLGMIVKYAPDGSLIQPNKGDPGFLIFSSVSRSGTPYINFAIGDYAYRNNGGVKNIGRASPDIALNSCAAGALNPIT